MAKALLIVALTAGVAVAAVRYKPVTERQLQRMDKDALIERVLKLQEHIADRDREIARLLKEVKRFERRFR